MQTINTNDTIIRLLSNSQEAIICGIEIHNKPLITYRYETVSILIVNAWELLLKAFIMKSRGIEAIYEKDGIHTIGITSTIEIIKTELHKPFYSIANNLAAIIDYRDKVIHFNTEYNIDLLLFSLIAKNVDNYIYFYKTYFDVLPNLLAKFSVLPLVFRIEKSPLSLINEIKNNSEEKGKLKEFITNLVSVIKECEDGEAILYEIDVNMQSIKKIENADLIVAIDSNAPIKITTPKKVIISSDENAQHITLTEEEIFLLYPFSNSGLTKEASKRYKFTQNSELHKKIKQEILCDPQACYTRPHHPMKKSGNDTFFSEKALSYFTKYCNLLKDN